MDPRRLELLLELSRLGSMSEVAATLAVSTSTVSQQLSVLSREAGATLIEPDGRRVRLTPAGRRLAEHAVTILAAIEAARADLDPSAEPSGAPRVAAFATAVRRVLLPAVRTLATTHPAVHLHLREHEPDEALALLDNDDVDLALVYDYNLAPRAFSESTAVIPFDSAAWGLGVPSTEPAVSGTSVEAIGTQRDRDWIVNSRNTADEDVVRSLAAMAGFHPRVTHRADSLDLVQEMIRDGLGVGLLPMDQPTIPGVGLVHLQEPEVRLRSFAATRLGRAQWPPLALLLRLVTDPA
ncbi:Transcriptional regulator [metagenome]|uniref:Transcriptional regulator n=1 Tax=metagenome TaxID=256318 RepID=A0A2P2CDS6_9ZZZZ